MFVQKSQLGSSKCIIVIALIEIAVCSAGDPTITRAGRATEPSLSTANLVLKIVTFPLDLRNIV